MVVKRILVPVDGSEQAMKAVEVALSMAEDFETEMIQALFVVNTALYSEPALSFVELLTDEVQEVGEEMMAELKAEAEERGISLETDVVHGKPKKSIVQQAESIDADLIVIGRIGAEPSGAVRKYVADNASCNVLVV